MATKRKVGLLDTAGADAPALSPKAQMDQDMRAAEKKAAVNKGIIESQKRIKISMSPMYAPYFGEVMTVSLNGLSIYFPVDGREYDVPEAYARIIHKRRKMVDSQQITQAKLGDLANNKDNFAGELVLVPR